MSVSLRYWIDLISKLRPSIPNVSKRSILLVSSITGVVAVCTSAIYFRRRKKPPCLPPTKCVKKHTAVRRRRHRKHKQSYSDSVSSHHSKQPYSRTNSSLSCSSVVSNASSIKSRRNILKNLDPETAHKAHELYLQGAGDLQTALDHWQLANSLISANSSFNSSPRSQSRKERARKRRSIKERSLSLSRHSIAEYDSTSQEEISDCGEATHSKKIVNNQIEDVAKLQGCVGEILERIENLEISLEQTFKESSSSGTDITLTGYNDMSATPFSDSDSAESFVSAHEVWDTLSNSEQIELTIYEEALHEVEKGRVKCRSYRTEILQCYSDTEFLAKLHCVRQAFDLMLKDIYVRDWLVDCGRKLISGILKSANRSADVFESSFTTLIDYVAVEENWKLIEEELNGRKVVRMSFYDIVLDFIILDAFDDLENPPASVLSVLNNRWLTNSLKETALSTAIWSVLKAKAQMLRQPDGFISKFYAVSENVSPVLAWGFMGSDEKLKATCMKFKNEILSFVRGAFNFDEVRYSNASNMSADILKLARSKIHNIFAYFESTQ